MLRPALLIFLVAIQSTTWKGSTAQLTYTIKATWLDDPEDTWTPALNENRWATYTESAENLGLTFAGKAEFPWIVDIRIDKKNVEYWSTGNLISETTVFTTCRAIDDLGDIKVDSHRVTFAQMYLWEYTQRAATGQDWALGGSRNILTAKKHKDCNIQATYFDGGIITLVNSIKPQPPTINTIQLAIDYNHGGLPDIDLSKQTDQRRICYIASFGRDYANIQNHLVRDFKVKYRVYYEKPELCNTFQDKMCPNHHFPGACHFNNLDDEGRELMCLKSRAKVGAVCDHDKGAPLVCDGQVFGLVILGAKQQYCNDVLALPFWVQKISMYEDYFVPTVKADGGTRDAGKRAKARTIGSSADSSFNPIGTLHLFPMIFPFISYQIQS